MPENSTSEATTTMPSPPRIWPTIAEASATRRREMPLVSISAPASTNSGMATNGNGSMPDIILCATVSSGIPSAMKPAMVPSAMLNATGMPSASSTTNTMTSRIKRCAGAPLAQHRQVHEHEQHPGDRQHQVAGADRERQGRIHLQRRALDDAPAVNHHEDRERPDHRVLQPLERPLPARPEEAHEEINAVVGAVADRERGAEVGQPLVAQRGEFLRPDDRLLHRVAEHHLRGDHHGDGRHQRRYDRAQRLLEGTEEQRVTECRLPSAPCPPAATSPAS